MLKGGLEMSQRRRCLGKCITKPQVLLWRFKILFMHKWTRTGTFSSTDSGTPFIPPLSPFPAAWEGLIRHKWKSNLAILRWESNILKFWGLLFIISIFWFLVANADWVRSSWCSWNLEDKHNFKMFSELQSLPALAVNNTTRDDSLVALCSDC